MCGYDDAAGIHGTYHTYLVMSGEHRSRNGFPSVPMQMNATRARLVDDSFALGKFDV